MREAGGRNVSTVRRSHPSHSEPSSASGERARGGLLSFYLLTHVIGQREGEKLRRGAARPFLLHHAAWRLPERTIAIPSWARETWRHMIDNLEERSAAEIGRLIAAGNLDPVEAAEFFLGRIERDRDNPSFILVTRERALEEAEASRKRRREGARRGRSMAFPSPGRILSTWAASAPPLGRRSSWPRRRRKRTRQSSRIWRRPAWWLWARPISRNSPSRRLDSTRISARREIRATLQRPASPEDPRPARRSRSLAVLRLARSAATPAARSGRRPVSAALSGSRRARGGSISAACFRSRRTLDTIGPLAHSVEDCVLIDMALRGQKATARAPDRSQRRRARRAGQDWDRRR